MIDNNDYTKALTLNCRGNLLSLQKPVVMGILNLTPDSFYSKSRVTAHEIVARARQMLEEGASIIDAGGYSTRPGAADVGVEEELERVIPAIEALHAAFPTLAISIDTFRTRVAGAAVKAGASIINDVSGGNDEGMFELAASLGTPYILMHSKGNPQTMQSLAVYDNLLNEVWQYFVERVGQLRTAGVKDIIVDPGFGFAKTTAHSFSLLKNMDYLGALGLPVLAGLSRKGMAYKTLGIAAGNSLNATTVLNTIALLNGANILRVHDVKAAAQAIELVRICQAG